MTLKLVLISPSGVLEKEGKLDSDDIQRLGAIISRLGAKGIRFAIWSNRNWTVNKQQPLEEYFSKIAGCEVFAVGMQHGMPARQRAGAVNPILQKFGVKLEETILVGARDEDLQAGVNNKLLLLRPAWYGGNLSYGFELGSISELERFCMLFGTREHPLYWSVSDDKRNFHASALGPFSTFIEKFALFGSDAYQAAKFEAGTLQFWHQLIVSTLYFSGIIHGIDIITVYPGHTKELKNKAFFDVLSLLSKCFNKPFYADLLSRHEDAVKSSNLKAAQRKFASQINTVAINRFPAKYGGAPRKSQIDLKKKNVLVVDDICTSGRSLETARQYLMAAGANAHLFSWLKTINTDFQSIEPPLKLAPFEKNTFNSEPSQVAYSYSGNIVDAAAADEINSVLAQFQKWGV